MVRNHTAGRIPDPTATNAMERPSGDTANCGVGTVALLFGANTIRSGGFTDRRTFVTRRSDRPAPRRRKRQCDQQQCGRREPRGALLPCATRASVPLRVCRLIRGDPPEQPPDIAHALPSFIRVLRKAALGDIVERPRRQRLTRGDGRGRIFQDGANHAGRRVALETDAFP